MKKKKKSIFFRVFTINLATLVASVLVLTITQTMLISQHIYKEKISELKEDSKRIVSFIRGGASPEHLTLFLNGFSHSTKSNVLIVGPKGDILLASTSGGNFNKNALQVDKKYLSDVLSNKETVLKGTLGDVYTTEMYTFQVPVFDPQHNSVVGAIFLSVPVPEINKSQLQLYKILLLSLIFVVFVSFALSFVLSKRLSEPIKRIGTVAKQFSYGDFSARVKPDKRSDEIVEISELTHSFNNMANSLEKADDVRNNFLSDVSHELRTPMTTISGFVDGILDETIPPERQRDYLLIVRDEIIRLSSLVTSFLSLTRLQTGDQPLDISVFDVNEIIRRTLVSFESKISEKNLNLNFACSEDVSLVKADMNLIRQVINNLVENAIKFTNPEGELKITTTQQYGSVFISVRNTGCGISENDLPLIFERFYKADKSRALNREGTGIGLYIVKEILNRHGKEISVSSREGEFAEFTFSLEKGKY